MDIDKIKNVCKLGQLHESCMYLLATSSGFQCTKLSPLKKIMKQRAGLTKYSGKGDNCIGEKTIKQANSHK